jgi:hypothetical protein
VAWDGVDNRIIVNRRGAGNLWSAYSVSSDGRDEPCITCRGPLLGNVGAATNRGASDLSPDDRYLLLVVEKAEHPGSIGEAQTDRGKGVYNDIWLATVNGTRFGG